MQNEMYQMNISNESDSHELNILEIFV